MQVNCGRRASFEVEEYGEFEKLEFGLIVEKGDSLVDESVWFAELLVEDVVTTLKFNGADM